MRIESSDIQMQSQSVLVTSERVTERLTYWEGDPTKLRTESRVRKPGVTLDLSEKAKKIIEKNEEAEARKQSQQAIGDHGKKEHPSVAAGRVHKPEIKEYWATTKEELTLRLLESFVNLVFGKKMKFNLPTFKLPTGEDGKMEELLSRIDKATNQSVSLTVSVSLESENSRTGANWGVLYEQLYERYEKEKMTFNAQGIIRTTDGKEINISLSLSMSRTLYERSYTAVMGGEGILIDPLVINYAGPAADLTDTKYSFDLDGDGSPNQISFLKKGSGFLVLDETGDGIIKDGTQMFGTKTGDGFAELAVYDSDGNGWIDKGDPIFDKLRIWIKDDNGNDRLLALGEVGIGAIYLGYVDSLMGIVGSDGKANGQVAKTGIFIRENGLAGTVQHVDLVV